MGQFILPVLKHGRKRQPQTSHVYLSFTARMYIVTKLIFRVACVHLYTGSQVSLHQGPFSKYMCLESGQLSFDSTALFGVSSLQNCCSLVTDEVFHRLSQFWPFLNKTGNCKKQKPHVQLCLLKAVSHIVINPIWKSSVVSETTLAKLRCIRSHNRQLKPGTGSRKKRLPDRTFSVLRAVNFSN